MRSGVLVSGGLTGGFTMIRRLSVLAIFVLASVPLRAGELDAEYGAVTKVATVATVATAQEPRDPAAATAPLPNLGRDESAGAGKASELDSESPTQAFHHGFGGFGHHYGGFGGYGRHYGGFG